MRCVSRRATRIWTRQLALWTMLSCALCVHTLEATDSDCARPGDRVQLRVLLLASAPTGAAAKSASSKWNLLTRT